MVLVTSMGLLAQGSTWETATLISSGQTKTGSFNQNHTEDWYKINVTQEGTIDFTGIVTSGDLTLSNSSSVKGVGTNGDLYDRYYIRGKESFRDDTITLNAINVGKGTYYIKILRYGGTGSYSLKYKFTQCPQSGDPEPNNEFASASQLQSGNTVQGRLGYISSDNVTDYDDWYKIVIPEEGHVELRAIAASGDLLLSYTSNFNGVNTSGNIYDRGHFTGKESFRDDTITFNATNVGKGTYYIRINRYSGSGGYKLYYKFTPCPLGADPEPNNDYEHASLLQSGTTAQGRLGYVTSENVMDGEDWYKIVVPEEGNVELKAIATEDLLLSNSSSFNGFKNGGTYSRGNFYGKESFRDDTITFNATNVGKGTYYIRILRYGGSGGYMLYYKFTPCPQTADPEPNNDYASSSLLQSGKTVQGRLGYVTSDDVTDAEDWYKIVVPEEGHIELMATVASGDLLLSNSSNFNGFKNGNTYNRGNISGTASFRDDTITFNATNVGKGTYYIRILRYGGSGGYKLYCKFTPCPLKADPEPNNSYEDYTRLLNGKTTEGRMGYCTSDDVTDTEDWYRIIVPQEGPIDVTINTTEDLRINNGSSIQGVRDDGSLYTIGYFSGNMSYGSTSLTYHNNKLNPGIYYFRITRYGGSGGYQITYNGPISEIPGDVDGDGILNIGDAAELIDYLLNHETAGSIANGDADGDGNITIADVTAILDRLRGN